MRGHPLLHLLKRPVAIFSLIALLVAQAAAGSHSARHLRLGGDGTDIPGVHTQLCLECASFAPLASAHGGGVTVFAVASLGVEEFVREAGHADVVRRSLVPYRSRAPPG
jgi:hypothetical protein